MNGHFNHGTFSVNSTDLKVKDGIVTDGTFSIPISSLNVLNLTGEPKGQLEGHLKSEDFFNILLHPTATFKITSTEPYSNSHQDDVVSGANYVIERGTVFFPGLVVPSIPGLRYISQHTYGHQKDCPAFDS